MVDPFSQATGAVSLVDAALRTCLTLYDLIDYLRDVPQVSQRLQRTVESIESILSDLNTFVKQYLSAARPIPLPDSVNKEILFIKEDLNALATLLSSTNKVRWVLNRKKFAVVQQSLERHQVSLTLAFQSFSSQQGIQSQDMILNVGEDIKRQEHSVANATKVNLDLMRSRSQADLCAMSQAADTVVRQQQQLHTNIEGLQRSIDNGNLTTFERLDAIESAMSDMRLFEGQTRPEIFPSTSTEDVLARVVRRELQREIGPTIRQCFDHSIDEIAHQVERRIHLNNRDISAVSTSASSTAIDGRETLEDFEACGTMDSATTDSPDCFVPNDNIDKSAHELESKFHASIQDYLEVPTQASSSAMDNHEPLEYFEARGTTDSAKIASFDCFAPNGRCTYGHRTCHRRRSWISRWAIGQFWVTISTWRFRRREPDVFYIMDTPFSQNIYSFDFQPAQSPVTMKGITLSVRRDQDQRGSSRICLSVSTFAVVPYDADVMFFAQTNNVYGLQRLFGRGLAAPSDRDEWGMTPLMCAARANAADAFRLLLEEGSDPLALDREELRPSQLQSWLDRGKFLNQLGFQLNDKSMVYFTAKVMMWNQKLPKENIAVMLSVLMKLGTDINSEWYGVQPLHLSMHASPTEENSGNFTALTLALLQEGADPCALDAWGCSPLDHAEVGKWTVKWHEVLDEAGFDIREVELEIEKRKWCRNNPGDGFAEKNTAVDEDDLAAPSTEGLSHRRATVGDRLDE
ncbi:hypothetical protein G7Y79_00052g087740 [Physcia stellaris]|nr:hypothetical protein G7Y79_00052g087740 [Physcia stellaris]